MSRFEEMKYREIADQLNISIKTVENQMGKALRILTPEAGLTFCLCSSYYLTCKLNRGEKQNSTP